MRPREFLNLNENAPAIRLYHGSRIDFPVGTILTAQKEGYAHGSGYDGEELIARQMCEAGLDRYRPTGAPSRKQAVFMCDNPDKIDLAGGYDDFIYEVEPIGDVFKANLYWYSDLEGYCFHLAVEAEEPDENDVRRCAKGYWNCVPNDLGEPGRDLIEYLAGTARIIRKISG
jgi:hypothetical protein